MTAGDQVFKRLHRGKHDAAMLSSPAVQGVMSVPALVARDIVVRYGGVLAVAGASITVNAGEAVGLVGPNGAGKSTMLGAIGGQIPISGGSICVRGLDVTSRVAHVRAQAGMVRTFQTTSEFEGLTVFENLLTAGVGQKGASLRAGFAGRKFDRSPFGVETNALAWQMLDRFEMTPQADRYAGELSGGQKRLVEIMRCLMTNPSVLLLDEPAVGVAPHLVQTLIERLLAVTRELGASLLLVEHALEVVRDVCDRVVVMSDGVVIADGTYDVVTQDEIVRVAYLGSRYRTNR